MTRLSHIGLIRRGGGNYYEFTVFGSSVLEPEFYAAPPSDSGYKVPEGWRVGNLLTMSDCDYPGMGRMFAQVWQGDDLIARVYGDSAKEVSGRVATITAAAPVAKKGEQE